MKRLALAVLCAAHLLLGAQSLAAQPARARIIVTVVDPSGAIIPDASVALVALDPGASATTIPPVKTTDKGLATIENLAPGRYSVTASFPGFELGLLKDVRLRSGDNKHVVVLPMQRLQSEVTVGRDAQAAAADPRARFGTALTRDAEAVAGHGGAERDHPGRQLRGGTTAAEVADQVDPHHP
jgi:carboxypeptidase family protein